MKVVDRKTFLALPVGTVYQKYEGHSHPESLAIKDGICGDNDWFYIGINTVELGPCSAYGFSLDQDQELDFETGGRDGCYDDEEIQYCIWSKEDISNLIKRLERTI